MTSISLKLAAILAACAALSGCLVIHETHYSDPDSAAAIRSEATSDSDKSF